MRHIFLSVSLFILIVSASFSLGYAKNAPSLLHRADELKHAERYEEAEKLYDEVLQIDPENREALRGKDDCRIMLTPIIPMQHIAPSFIDPEYQELIKRAEEAKTPWDKKRAEIAIEHYAVRYTGKVFGEDKQRYAEKADGMVNSAKQRLAAGGSAEQVYRKTVNDLLELQDGADRSWKGHGPEIFESAVDKLNVFYLDNGYQIPDLPHKSYKLESTLNKSDIDPAMIKSIDSIPPPYPPGGKYQIGDLKYMAGKYRIMKFICEYQGTSKFSDEPASLHDLLVLKIDNKGIITDAFHYTLEWTDSPSLDLYRLGKKNLKLKSGMNIRELKLKNESTGKRLLEDGDIRLK